MHMSDREIAASLRTAAASMPGTEAGRVLAALADDFDWLADVAIIDSEADEIAEALDALADG